MCRSASRPVARSTRISSSRRQRVLEQSGLPDARLAHEHEGAADPQPRRRDQSADGLALGSLPSSTDGVYDPLVVTRRTTRGVSGCGRRAEEGERARGQQRTSIGHRPRTETPA